MSNLINLISGISLITRLVDNKLKLSSIKGTLKKLENNKAYRMALSERMYFTVGMQSSDNLESKYSEFYKKLHLFRNETFEVKGVYDLNENSFLIFVQCTDHNIEIGHNGKTVTSKFIKLQYYRINKIPKDNKIEMCTYTSNDLNEKNLLRDFYKQFEISLQ